MEPNKTPVSNNLVITSFLFLFTLVSFVKNQSDSIYFAELNQFSTQTDIELVDNSERSKNNDFSILFSNISITIDKLITNNDFSLRNKLWQVHFNTLVQIRLQSITQKFHNIIPIFSIFQKFNIYHLSTDEYHPLYV